MEAKETPPEKGFAFKTNAGTTIDETTYGPRYVAEYRRILQKYADRPNLRLLEWGSGITTKVAIEHCAELGSGKITSIDHGLLYVEALATSIKANDFLHMYWADEIGSYGAVGPNYSTLPLYFGTFFDFILIDGRRRLECALIAAKVAGPLSTIVLHDFRRERYRMFDTLFDVIEPGPEFKVCRPRPAVVQALSPVPLTSLKFSALNDSGKPSVKKVYPIQP